MIENSEQEKETNIINSINSIKISELENNTKNQNIPQEFLNHEQQLVIYYNFYLL